jgi:hypothetical protein
MDNVQKRNIRTNECIWKIPEYKISIRLIVSTLHTDLALVC